MSEEDPLARTFRKFASLHTHGMTPLYGHLGKLIASDPEILELAELRLPGQPAPNVLFGAVHYLLLSGHRHPLGRYYASISKGLPAAPDPHLYPHFRDFCTQYREKLVGQIRSRRTQTNEVNRCSLILPVFVLIASMRPATQLRLIEIGTSAGLNLNWQRYQYNFGLDQRVGPIDSEVVLESEVRGSGMPSIPLDFLTNSNVERNLGIELFPLDLRNPDDVLWLQALIWPEHLGRMSRLKAAMAVAQKHPPEIVQGDALEALPALLESLPDGIIPVLFHTFVLYQFAEQDRKLFLDILSTFGQRRQLYRLAIEWIGGQAPTIELDNWDHGKHTHRVLANCNPHGRWIEWR